MTIDNTTNNKISIALWLYSVAPPLSFTLSLPLQKETQNCWFIFCKMKVPWDGASTASRAARSWCLLYSVWGGKSEKAFDQ